MSRTIYFLWHPGTQAAYGQRDADSGADKGGNGKEKGLKEGKVMLGQHTNCLNLTKSDAKEGKVVLRQHANCLDLTKSDAKEGLKVVLESRKPPR
jgi:hypothetical protein